LFAGRARHSVRAGFWFSHGGKANHLRTEL
jgi:hypothetical protein